MLGAFTGMPQNGLCYVSFPRAFIFVRMHTSHSLEAEMPRELDASTKGVPNRGSKPPLTTAEVRTQGWNLLREDLPFPNAVIRESALHHNLDWMRRFTQERGVLLAPHGKTSMAPQLFNEQLKYGAWGITVATAQQLKVCRKFGINRIFMANQLVSRQDIGYVFEELSEHSEFDFYCLVDSVEGVDRLRRFSSPSPSNPANLFLEVGVPGGRTGCRTLEQAIEVLREVAGCANVQLRGIECFEGISAGGPYRGDLERVDAFFTVFREVHDYCVAQGLFDDSVPVILSAGGSAYFDLAADALREMAGDNTQILLRSGCYITHDSLLYGRMAERFAERNPRYSDEANRLRPALEVWGQVQSLPEPGLAIMNVGKRDVSHDIELPTPLLRCRPGTDRAPSVLDETWKVTSLNDQHAYLSVPLDSNLAVGDLIGLGISHPCTTFDKWRLLWLVDDDYQVRDAIWTYF